ncbi:hypothetical protein D3C76_924010 [compost metagenome]
MVEQVVGVGQQLLGAVAFLDGHRLGQVVAHVEHVADLAQGHQELHEADFALVLALRRTDLTHLGIGRAAQPAANAVLAGVLVDDVGGVGALQAVEEGEVLLFLHHGLHRGVQRLDAQGAAAFQLGDVGLVVAGFQGLDQVRASTADSRGHLGGITRAGELGNEGLCVH